MRPLVVGVGTAYRRDDGVGPQVAAMLRDDAGLDVVEAVADAAALVLAWEGRHLVVVVDAVRTGASPGTVHVWRLHDDVWDAEPPEAAVSGHLWGVGTAVRLARGLDRLPRSLVLVGVEAADLGQGEGLSAPVHQALPEAAGTARAEALGPAR